MAQSNVSKYLEGRKKRLESAGDTTNVRMDEDPGSYGSEDKVNAYLQRREKRISGSGYEQKLRQRDVIVGARAQEERNRREQEANQKPTSELMRRQAIRSIEDAAHGYARERTQQGMGDFQQEDRRTFAPAMRSGDPIFDLARRAVETQEIPGLDAGWRTGALDTAQEAIRGRREFFGDFSRPEEYAAYLKKQADNAGAAYETVKARLAAEEPTAEDRAEFNARLMENAAGFEPAHGNLLMGKFKEGALPDQQMDAWMRSDERRDGLNAQAAQNREARRDAMRKYYDEIPHMEDFDADQYQMSIGDRLNDFVLRRMTAEERAIYRYLSVNQGEEAAQEYYEIMKPEIEQRELTEAADELYQMGRERPVLGSALSVMLAAVQGIGGIENMAREIYGNAADEEYEIDPYDRRYHAGYLRDALRSGAAENMGAVGGFIYQTGMSIGDSLAAAVLGGGAAGGAAMIAGGAATDTMRSIKTSGGSDEQAIGLSILAGGAELLTEKMGFDRLGELIGGSRDGIMRQIIGHMVSELGEEAGTEAANIIADALVMGDRSQYMELVRQYGGDERAHLKALGDVLGQVGLAGLGGAISGGVMGGGAGAVNVAMDALLQRDARRQAERSRMTDALGYGARMENAPAAQNADGQERIARLAEQAVENSMAEAAEAPAAQQMRTETAAQKQAETSQEPGMARRGTFMQRSRVESAAAAYGEDATVYTAHYDGGDTEQYRRGFDALYNAGMVNIPLEKMDSMQLTAGMDEATKRQIWQAGRNRRMKTVRPGTVMQTTQRLTHNQRAQIRILDELGKHYGLEIVVVDSIAGGRANAAYVTGGRRIAVALDAAEQAYVQAAAHEMVHYIKSGDADAYGVLESVVLEHLTAADSDFDLEYAINARLEEYRRGGLELSREDAIEEIVAEAVPTVFTDRESVRELVRNNRTLAEKIRDFIADFSEKLREIAERYMQRDGADRDEIANLLDKTESLKEIARTFDAALETAGEDWSGKTTGIDLKESSQYSLKERKVIEGYLEAVDADILEAARMYRNDKNAKYARFKLGEVNENEAQRIEELLGVDTRGYTRNIDKNAFNHIEKRHGPDGEADQTMADLNDVARMNWVLENYDSIEQAVDKNGHPVYAKGYLDSDGNPAAVVVYRKRINGIYYVSEAVADNKWKKLWVTTAFMSENKKDASQTPNASKEAPGFTSENESAAASDSSISDDLKDVNGQTKLSVNSEAFRKWFGDSKIVNEDGSPKVMYHGTDAYKEFNVFKKGKRGWLGPGIYLTESQNTAEHYAKKNGYDGRTYALYAKVENPLIVTEGNPVPEVLRAVSGSDRLYINRSAKQTNEVFMITAADIKKLQAKGYDGIIWRFGKGPIEVSVFSPEQIKSATDNVGTYDPDNPDIRFSLNSISSVESIMADDANLMLPADVDVRAESIRGAAASALSRGISERMDQQIAGVANKILKETGSTYAKADIIANMKKLIAEYAENGATEDTLRAVSEMAKKIIETSRKRDDGLREQYAELRKKLRETGISLTETQKQEAANEAGSYDAWRRNMMGTVKLTNDGISLDAIWNEMSGQNPEIFPADTGEAEMVGKLTDFMMLMKPKYENPYGMDMDGAALEMAMRIQGDMMGIIGAKDAAKAMYGTAEKFRRQYEAEFKAKLAQQKKERVEKFQQIAADLKAAKAKGDSAEQAKIMNRYRAAMKATALDEAYAEIRATYKEREAQKAENRKANELRGRVAKQAGELMKMFTRPEKGKRIPTGLQGLVLDALGMLDINGERAAEAGKETQKAQAFREKLTGIRTFYEQVINNQSKGEAPEGMDGLMMAFTERNMAAMNEALDILGGGDKFRLRDMNSEQLKMLDELLKNIKHTVDSVGKLWKIHRYQSVIELGDRSIEEMDARGDQKISADSTAGKARDFLALDMLEPVSYGERLGEGGGVIIQGLLDGEKEKFSKIREAAEATGRMMKEAGISGYDIGKWRKNVRTIRLGSGKVIKMSDVNIMELYLTAKRPQGLQHLLANGMKIQSKEAGQQPKHITLTQADITDISGMLDAKQKKMADLMQGYLSGDVAKWGNDVTQRLYLYDAFTEPMYWPISSDPNSLKTQEPEGDRAFTAITNAGFTKPLNVKATNPIIIGDAFDTFNRHIGEMASYAGYAEVMTDTLAWLNYRQRGEDGLMAGSVKESIETLLGKGGIKYLTKLVQDINGARRGGDNLQLANALLRNYKANAVAGKIRVAIQQPTSIVRAAAEMSPAYLLKGMKAGKGAVQEMQKWSSLAWWKSNGNYDIGIGRSTDEIFWGDTKRRDTVMDKIATSGGLIDPGKMDDWAWARMWSAVKRETNRLRPELKQGSDEYFRAVAERFEYIMDRTQVVDTIMHRSDIMRSKDGLMQTLTSFKAEPIKSYNMLMRAIMEAGRDPRSRKARVKLARTAGAFAASAAATAAATALFDAFKNRDDDDDIWTYMTEGGFWTDWAEAWLNGFAGNINIAASIPLVGEAIEAAQGQDVTMMQFEGIGNIAGAATTFMDHFFGDNKKKTTKWGAMKPAITAISQLAGLPVSGLIANAEMLVRIYDPKLMQAKSEMSKQEDAYRLLYEAMAKGNAQKAADIRAQLTAGLHGAEPKNPKEIDTGIAHALAKNDERVMEAYRMREAGNRTKELLALKKQIMADGFNDAQVTAAINYCETLADTEETEKDMEAQLKAKLFDTKDLFNAIRSGSAEDAAEVAEYLESVSEAKDPAKSIKSSVSGEFRQEYLSHIEAGRTKQADALAGKLAAVGIDAEDLTGWVKDDRYDGMKAAVESGNAQEARNIAGKLREAGADTSDIVSSLNGRFKEVYIEFMHSGRRAEADRLKETLQALDLRWKDGQTNYYRNEVFSNWLKDAE